MFKGFFKKRVTDKQEEPDISLSGGIESSVLRAVGPHSIPTMPAAAQKAFQLSTDPNAEARDFVEIIEADEAMSARILKIANSVFFDRGKPTDTIEDAVTLIGINELRCLLNATTLSDLFPSRHSARTQLWANDIATGLIARSLAENFIPEKAEVAFLAGLMHDIGKLLMLQRLEPDYVQIIRRAGQEGISFCEAEQDFFVFNHSEAGLLIAERWKFSRELKLAIAKHHNSWEELENESDMIVRLVKAADLISHSLGLGHPSGFGAFRNNASDQINEIWERLSLNPADQRDMLHGFKRTFELEYDLYAGSAG
ncbi:MAG: HDOD domain-containing protein [Candidatus Dadabacteria bacterium]|nr:MAG: HDOD domain-containing protein [Candidatus Dadabacteria bacterium]